MLKINNLFTPKIRSKGFKILNKCKTSLGFKPMRDYKLLYKAEKIDVAAYTGKRDWLVPHEAVSFNYVKVGKKSDPDFTSEILSFYNENNKIITRLFRQNGLNVKKREYSYGSISRTICTRDFVLPKLDLKKEFPFFLKNLAGGWCDKIFELQIVEEYPQLKGCINKKNIDTNPMGLYTKKVEYSGSDDKDSARNITFTKYPINLGIQKPSAKKVISGTVLKKGKNIELTNVTKSDNLDLNLDDEFLKFRFIDPRSDEGLRLLSDYYIKQKGLEALHISVSPSVEMGSSFGSFRNGELRYSQNLQSMTSREAVDTVAHEVEHAYQHAQIGRLGKGFSRYESEAERLLPPIEYNEIKEAVKYAKASSDYPVENVTVDNPRYRNNYLEVKAREAGQKARDLYMADKSNFYFFDFYYKK